MSRRHVLLIGLLGLAQAQAAQPDAPPVSGSHHDGQGSLSLVHPALRGEQKGYLGFVLADTEAPVDSGLSRITAARVAVGYGLGPHLRLDAELPYYATLLNETATDVASGMGDVKIGATIPIVAPGERYAVGAALSPWITAPTAAPVVGETVERARLGVVAAVGGELENTRWRVNGGLRALQTEGAAYYDVGFGLDQQVTPVALVGAELTGVTGGGLVPGAGPIDGHGYITMGRPDGTQLTLFGGTALREGPGSAALEVGASLSLRTEPYTVKQPSYSGAAARPRSSDKRAVAYGTASRQRDLCPNAEEDRDGYMDEDGCPDPDNDGDGVPDGVDGCVFQAEDGDGFADRDGCPEIDNDLDALVDADDQCPNQAGPSAAGGCPDDDSDGVADISDECPMRRGSALSAGCPDWDGDRVPDHRDVCPDRRADHSVDVGVSDGCPSFAAAWRDRIEAPGGVRFQTNAATLAPESHAVLLAVAAELLRHPEIRRIEVAGHTDAQGNADYNLALSQVRAEEVRRFLIEQGGLSPDRVLARGFGEAAPIDRNDTVSGRARNRRVEFLVVDPAPRG